MNQKEGFEDSKVSHEEELSMEEILASIRRIVNDEPGQSTWHLEPSDILELTNLMEAEEEKVAEPLELTPTSLYKPQLPNARMLRQTELSSPYIETSSVPTENLLKKKASGHSLAESEQPSLNNTVFSEKDIPQSYDVLSVEMKHYERETASVSAQKALSKETVSQKNQLSEAQSMTSASPEALFRLPVEPSSETPSEAPLDKNHSLYDKKASIFLQGDYDISSQSSKKTLSSPEKVAMILENESMTSAASFETETYPSFDMSAGLSEETSASVLSAFKSLSEQSLQPQSIETEQPAPSSNLSVEDLVRQSLQPQLDAWVQNNVHRLMSQMLTSWMDKHLADIVKKAVQEEIQKITNGL